MENVKKLVVVVSILILGFHGLGCFGCHKDELDALLQLKSEINHPNGTALADWTEEDMTGRPSECCYWRRVSCEKSAGRVMYLGLNYTRQDAEVVQGEWYVNASLFLPFPHLQQLNLAGNSITGWTHHLRQLSSLKELDLSYNKLKGMIDLHGVEALQNLKFLDLSGNSVDGFKRIHGTPHSMSSKLATLFLKNITFRDANTLLEDSLLSFPSLKTLYLGENDFTGAIKTTVFQSSQQLKMISLSRSSLSRDFLQNLGTVDSLECLVMVNSTLKGDISSHRWLCQLKKLLMLDISKNDLHGQLPSCLGNLTSLQYLDLSSNQFTGNIANSPLTKLSSLQALSLSNNNFQIPQTFISFANHSSLKLLLLDGNTVVPANYATHRPFTLRFQLSYLSLSDCEIGPTLPHFILHQYNLTFLDLSHNYIVGNFPDWIVQNNKFLVTLTLANNLLIGSLHLSSYPHSEIKELDVSYNNISYLSANLSQSLPNIMFLNLSRNSIKVITPSNFCDMKNLGCLDLSHNQLTGEVPKHFIKGCFSLETLILSHNNLEVISPLSNSSSLRILRLNNNNLSGVIPPNLFSSSLESLDMSNNHLGGHIPPTMCKLNYLIFLDLSNNSFSGFLPPCLCSSSLVYVYLNKNNLNGPLLPVFKNSTSLMTLDLGDNHLSGVIPEWIGNLRNLSILSFRNNHFEGHIPTQLCSLDQLTILDLSSNNIFGHIPRCLNKVTFQPHEKKSVFIEYDAYLPIPGRPLEFVVMVHDNETLGYMHIYESFTIQNEMEITTKSHTYTYVGKDLDVMSIIDLSCNKLSGYIPPEIGSMIGLRALNLSFNELTGSVPSTLSKLIQIESLDLSYNSLNGSIPLELIQLNALEVFSVAHNDLSGRTPEQKAQFATFEESSYQGNPFLCGPPLLNDCFTPNLGSPKNHNVDDVNGSMDMDIFFVCFIVSFVIMFVGTLIVLYVSPHWREVWFYYGELWITSIYYFIVDSMRKALETSACAISRFIHCH